MQSHIVQFLEDRTSRMSYKFMLELKYTMSTITTSWSIVLNIFMNKKFFFRDFISNKKRVSGCFQLKISLMFHKQLASHPNAYSSILPEFRK